jgi:hypothetical protein
MAKNAWNRHLENYMNAHPGTPFSKAAKEASKTYKKKQHGGLSALAYSPYHDSKGAGIGTTGVGLQLNATNYGGSKRKRTARRKAKYYGGKRRCSTKRRN